VAKSFFTPEEMVNLLICFGIEEWANRRMKEGLDLADGDFVKVFDNFETVEGGKAFTIQCKDNTIVRIIVQTPEA